MTRGFGVAAGLDPEVAAPLAARCQELDYSSMWSNDHPGANGLETLADGRCVVKVRIRSPAEGGEANRALIELLARALEVPKKNVRLMSGATSRLKQVAVDGNPAALGEALRVLTSTRRKRLKE